MPKEESYFIERLFAAIQEHRSSVVDWDPSGKGFIVGNLTQFTNQVLIKKFNIGRLDSFARKLNRHGFKRSKIDRNKIRFFHKYFSRDSKQLINYNRNIGLIKKLTKLESLPKHIKLRMIREQRQQLNNKNLKSPIRHSDIVSEIFQTTKIKQTQQKKQQKQHQLNSHSNINSFQNVHLNISQGEEQDKYSQFLKDEDQNDLCKEYGNYGSLYLSPNKDLKNQEIFQYRFRNKINLSLDDEDQLQKYGCNQSNSYDQFHREKYQQQLNDKYFQNQYPASDQCECSCQCSCSSPKTAAKGKGKRKREPRRKTKSENQATSVQKRKTKQIQKTLQPENKIKKRKVVSKQ